MKYRLLILVLLLTLILLGICLLFSQQILQPAGLYLDQQKNVDGIMTFTVRTVTYNGTYAPRHVFAIWVTNDQNQFVKSIKVCAAAYRSKLIRWLAASANNTAGAVTSASLLNHQQHTVSWNGADYQGNAQPDGDYTINVEFSEHNATSSYMGKYKTVTFSKAAAPLDQSPASEANFTDLHLTWIPGVTNGNLTGAVTNAQNVPVIGAQITAGTVSTTTSVHGLYSLSIAPGAYTVTCQAGGYATLSQENVIITAGQTTTLNLLLSSTANQDDNHLPQAFVLQQNYPNPFQQSTRINYYLDKSAQVNAFVFNSKGQKVADLVAGKQFAGWQQMVWNGQNAQHKNLPAGVYFLQVSAGGRTATRTLTLK